MINWKSKYLEMKLKYTNYKQLGGDLANEKNREELLLQNIYNDLYLNFPTNNFDSISNISPKEKQQFIDHSVNIIVTIMDFVLNHWGQDAIYTVNRSNTPAFCRSITNNNWNTAAVWKEKPANKQKTNSPSSVHTDNNFTFCNANPRGNWAIPLPPKPKKDEDGNVIEGQYVDADPMTHFVELKSSKNLNFIDLTYLHFLLGTQIKTGKAWDRGFLKSCCSYGTIVSAIEKISKIHSKEFHGFILLDTADAKTLVNMQNPITAGTNSAIQAFSQPMINHVTNDDIQNRMCTRSLYETATAIDGTIIPLYKYSYPEFIIINPLVNLTLGEGILINDLLTNNNPNTGNIGFYNNYNDYRLPQTINFDGNLCNPGIGTFDATRLNCRHRKAAYICHAQGKMCPSIEYLNKLGPGTPGIPTDASVFLHYHNNLLDEFNTVLSQQTKTSYETKVKSKLNILPYFAIVSLNAKFSLDRIELNKNITEIDTELGINDQNRKAQLTISIENLGKQILNNIEQKKNTTALMAERRKAVQIYNNLSGHKKSLVIRKDKLLDERNRLDEAVKNISGLQTKLTKPVESQPVNSVLKKEIKDFLDFFNSIYNVDNLQNITDLNKEMENANKEKKKKIYEELLLLKETVHYLIDEPSAEEKNMIKLLKYYCMEFKC